MNHIVGVADYVVSKCPQDILITYSLGSCLGITLHDAVAGVGGLLHCMLPLSKIDNEKAQGNPSMFVDTGMAHILQVLFDMGAQRKRMTVKVAGGAHVLDDQNTFNIGERNYTVFRKVLWKNNLMITGEDVGGTIPRTMALDMDTGLTRLRSKGMEREL